MTPAERRRQENAELVRLMKCGDPLCHTDSAAFSWAPRPIIKKDAKEMQRIYGEPEGAKP